MLVTLSEPRFSALIRSLENLPDHTDQEILEFMSAYSQKLWLHLRNYGLYGLGLMSQRGQLADFELRLAGGEHRQGDPRQIYIDGLTLLNPVHCTVQRHDLAALVINPPVRVTIADHFSDVAGELTKIQPGEIIDRLETVASNLVFHSVPDMNVHNAPSFETWAKYNKLPLPPKSNMELRQERWAKEAKERRKAADARYVENVSDWHLRES